jgi:N-carbamoyl-L-amino-acid hydrolase
MTMNSVLRGIDLDATALARDLEWLGGFGTEPGAAGLHRLAFGAEDLRARAAIEDRMRELGMTVRRDSAGNTIGVRRGADPALPAIAIGSHTDTVPGGGRFDGALGVLTGLACVKALAGNRLTLRHDLEVINFAAEEATLGGGLFGSRAMTGQLPAAVAGLPAWGDSTVAARASEAGIDARALSDARRSDGALRAFLELHIEQGPVLEGGNIAIGIVERVVGIRAYTASFTGRPGHAGTTPMAGRDDALVKAAAFIGEVPGLAAAGTVATVGTASVDPGASNVIPGHVALSLDIRGSDDHTLDAVEAALGDAAARNGGELSPRTATPPVAMSPALCSLAAKAAARRELTTLRLTSGAGHDAMCIAAITETALIFVPSRGGLSHCPDEYTEPALCGAGAQVLLDTLLELDHHDNQDEEER